MMEKCEDGGKKRKEEREQEKDLYSDKWISGGMEG